ncbi:MAG TPA: IS110 family transposase [Bacteroidales bacterium]|jgi:transposase|nr:IS110 family transposase [Bacteroidales bacterium]
MKQIYGIDLSKEKFDVCFLNEKKELIYLEIKNKYSPICKFLSKLKQNSILCIEHTGVYGYLLMFLANSFNVQICAIPGYEIKHSLGLQKGKSDSIDASRIREYGERFYDKLQKTTFYSEEMNELKELHSLRKLLVKQHKMLETSMKEKDKQPFCSLMVNKIAETTLETLNKQIEEIENQIQEIITSNEEFKANSCLIQSIKGIGPVTTNELIIKTHNFQKIQTAKKGASFAGICPFPDKSGKMVKKSKVSKMSDKSLKTLLFLCASNAIQHNKDMKHYYEKKLAEGKPKYLALNNVANKLIKTVYAILESRQMYDPFYICPDPRKTDKKVA